jgi:aminopeptidase N
MRTDLAAPEPVRLADYRPPDFQVDTVALAFRLDPAATRVKATLAIRRTGPADAPLVLDGARLKTLSVALDGRALNAGDYVVTDETLTLPTVPDAFTLETEVEINPSANTALEGLYMSGGRFCTQCEPEGFRTITWFLDRPDVLARYRVRIEADAGLYPHLLSNGNGVGSGALEGGRHFAEWEDPFPKPSYLFALVAGELDVLEDRFTTMSGREVALRLFVDPGMTPRAAYAMDSLKRAMRWDQETYGREYDLDLFMIVAVRDFNFGAMENKGLNIFNSSLLLADPQTATDADYERIESVVAHEYFHNWTGDRITCRDWFQLCLKEGLTVYRDQGFSADMRGHAVQRIKDVRLLRARQFPEDDGPLAHPVRPASYLKIDNFYTATIYEKGAELIGVLRALVGEDAFKAGMQLYFDRCDGQAVTMEDFVACFAEASGQDLSAHFRWYETPGTPELRIEALYDEAARTLTLALSQAGRPGAAPRPIPVRLGLLDESGAVQRFRPPGANASAEETTLVLDAPARTVVLEDVERLPVLSALRGFSAPVKLTTDEPPRDAYVRMAADPDLFNRWEAGQGLARDLILRRAAGTPDEVSEERYADALGRALADPRADYAFKALMLAPPSEGDLAQAVRPVDPQALHDAREALRGRLAVHLGPRLRELHGALQDDGEFSPDAAAAGRRALRNAVIDLIVADKTADAAERASLHAAAALNMTDAIGGLAALSQVGGAAFEAALEAFYAQWKDEPQVIDKWFSVQARSPADDALGRVLGLTLHPAFDQKNPNRFRALVQGFSVGNPLRFHSPDGAGHRFLADQILSVDAFNPLTASRLIEPLGAWARYAPPLADSMRAQLARIAAHPGVSKNSYELASRALEAAA